MGERFRLHDPVNGDSLDVWGWPPKTSGSERLGGRLQPYLEHSALVLAQSLDPETGERGTKVVEIPRGGAGWLGHCLRQAARQLRLHLEETG